MTTSSLETSLLQKILSSGVLTHSIMPFLADHPSNLTNYLCTSRAFLDAIDQPSVWKALIKHRYGEEVLKATLNTAVGEGKPYGTLKEAVLKDDNAEVAIPTLRFSDAGCTWRHNGTRHPEFRVSSHYCCIVQGIKWNRKSSTFGIYFDARGERDLRGPVTSRIGGLVSPAPASFVRSVKQDDCSLSERSRAGHFQGVIRIHDAYLFVPTSTITFQYSAAHRDYPQIILCKVPGNSLPGLFGMDTSKPEFTVFSNANRNCFETEDKEQERRRWQRFLPDNVLDRNRGLPNAWWVEDPEPSLSDSDSD